MDRLHVINVLPKGTFEDCHIKGSVSVPLEELEQYAKKLDKDTPIVVYCASYTCPLSAQAYRKLHSLGFTNLKAYEGGMAEWVQKDFPSVGSCSFDYLKQKEEPQEREGVMTIQAEELKQWMAEEDLL